MEQIRVTAIACNGTTIQSGWFANKEKGEKYASAMATRGYVVVREYRTIKEVSK